MEEKLCECGCGDYAKPGNRFINHHHGKKPKPEPELCECGCGELAKPGKRFIKWHNNPMKDPAISLKSGNTKKGTKRTDTTKKLISESLTGKKLSHEHCMALSESAIKRWSNILEREKLSKTLIKHFEDSINREKLSAAQLHIPYYEWESFASEQKYCPAFNEECKESNREKYGRRCFLTGLPEKENITSTGKWKRLSVHHIDMDKKQGCDGKRWKLIPVCIKWHGRIHNELWEFRIIWLLNNVWN